MLFGYEKRLLHRRACTRTPASSSRRRAARCCSTKSPRCRWRCRRSCCACCRSAKSSASAAACRWRSTCASSPRPTATAARRSRRRPLPRRPLLPPQRVPAGDCAAARTPRRHPAAGHASAAAARAVPASAFRRCRPMPRTCCSPIRWPGNVRELDNLLQRAAGARRRPGHRGRTHPVREAGRARADAVTRPSSDRRALQQTRCSAPSAT